MIAFNTDNMVQQEFPFPAPIMDYIFKNITASQLLKLYKTCKYFYAKFRLNIIEDFEIPYEDVQRIVGNSLAIWLDNPAWSKLNNLWITKSFTYCEHIDADGPLELDHQKFARLTYKSLTIYGRLSVSDYEFLIKPPTIRHLFVDGAIVSHALKLLSIEDIIERAPHVSAFDLYDVNFPTNMANLISLERQTKIQSLHLSFVSRIPNALRVVEFFKKHATPDIDYFFGFDFWDDEENVKTFFKAVNDGLRAWKTLQLPPTISSSFIDLTGKLAVITACDGIGKATAILFRQLGASVVVFSRNSIELKNLVEECQSIENDGSLHTRHVLDLFPYYFEIFDYRFGSKIDILINYCDIYGYGGVPDMESEEKFRTEHFVTKNHCELIRAAKPYLTEAKGTMINVSNPHDLIVIPGKAAFIAQCELNIKNDEAELLRDGVRINNVDSGAPVTSLPRPHGLSDFDYKKLLETTQKAHEEQIANSIAFLASDAAINEHTVPINAKF